MNLSSARVALVHDWLTGMRGGEKVLEVFADLFPDAPIYTLLHVPGSVSERIESHPIHVSGLQKLPKSSTHYRYYLPMLPYFIERMKLPPVDLVVSTSSCVVKGVAAPSGAKHASYIFSPMRYLYDRYEDYFSAGRAGLMTRAAMRLARRPLQHWDIVTAGRIDSPMAISTFIADRIRRVYGRPAGVIHPPVEAARFAAASRKPEDYYLMVCALVPYKNVDVAVEAFRGLDRKLVVAGSGPMYDKLKATCPKNVELRGWVEDAELVDLVAGCRAFLFPNVEDFGIAPVEAMSAGRPVIALGEGGALDTIRDTEACPADSSDRFGPTGLFFSKPDPCDLADAIRRFEREEHRFDSDGIAAWARQFDRPRFVREAREWLAGVLASESVSSAA